MRHLILVMMLLILATAIPASAGDTTISGFVDASWFWDTAAPNGEFGLDQAEVDIEHQASDKTFMRADLEWVKNGEGFDAQVEQAFMTYVPRCGWAFTLGKFNAPIGFEMLDAPDMYQFSHSLVFDFGLPTNLTGFSVSKDLGQGFDVIAYGVNGWDQNTETGANLTWGGRAGYASGGFSGGLSAISGSEEMEAGEGMTKFSRTVLDVDLSYELPGWVFGAELNRGMVTLADDSEQEWMGMLVMAHHDFNDWAGLTVRVDQFDDADGYAFDAVGGEFQVRRSFTIAPTFTLDDGFGALVELRIDTSDQDAFVDGDGEPTGNMTTVAFEMTYTW
jgi:hypothetical protein